MLQIERNAENTRIEIIKPFDFLKPEKRECGEPYRQTHVLALRS